MALAFFESVYEEIFVMNGIKMEFLLPGNKVFR
jgi:hypothetical protein